MNAIWSILNGVAWTCVGVMLIYGFAGGSLYFPRLSNPQRGFKWALAVWSDARLWGVYIGVPCMFVTNFQGFATDSPFYRGLDVLFACNCLWWAWCWYKYNPNDKWKKRKQRLKEKVKALNGRLVVVPN